MYSVELEDNRIVVSCIYNDTVVRPSIFQVVFDTGAKYTVVRAMSVNKNLREEDLVNNECKIICGAIKNSHYKIYKVHVRQLTLYDIDLGEQDIWVTFNKSVGDDVLGFDIIKQVSFYFDSDIQSINLFRDMNELRHYIIDEDIKNLAAAFRK